MTKLSFGTVLERIHTPNLAYVLSLKYPAKSREHNVLYGQQLYGAIQESVYQQKYVRLDLATM